MHRRAGLILKESTAFGGCAQISKETAKVSEGCSVDRVSRVRYGMVVEGGG